jgi:hypothetical protein
LNLKEDNRMRKTLVLFTALAAQMLAGGFFLQLGNPEASPEARKLGAALTVKAAGCHDPATAKLTANAIGEVNGHRRTVPLEVKSLSEPGAFAVVGTWPKEGKWVMELVATNGEQFTNTLVALGPNGPDRLHAKADMHKFAAADLDAMLR